MKKITKILCLIMCAVLLFSANISGVQAAAVSVSATTKLTATSTADTVKLSWYRVSKATGYRVYRVEGGKLKALKTLKTNKYTVEGLTANETYKFAVKTYVIQNGKTCWSSKYKTVTIKTKAMAKPAKPTATAAKNAVTLKWAKVAGATGYNVYQYKSGNWVKVKTVKTTTAKITSLKVDTTYKFKVRPYATTSSGNVNGKYSDTVSAKTVDITKAKFKTPIISSKSVVLMWDLVPDATGYRIRMMKNGSWEVAADGIKDTSLYIAGLSSNTEYTFQVVGYKVVDGKTTWFTRSDPLTFKTIGATTTTTKPTTTQPTTKPTTTQPSTTTTTKPSTGGSESQTTTKPSDTTVPDLKAYRLKQYEKLISGNEVYLKISDPSGSEDNQTMHFAKKNGKIYLKASVNMEGQVLNAIVSYEESKDKVEMAFSMDDGEMINIPSWLITKEIQEEFKAMVVEIMQILQVKVNGEITVSRTTFNGISVVREGYTDSQTGESVRCYFDGDTLVGIIREHPQNGYNVFIIEKISSSVDEKIFNM